MQYAKSLIGLLGICEAVNPFCWSGLRFDNMFVIHLLMFSSILAWSSKGTFLQACSTGFILESVLMM